MSDAKTPLIGRLAVHYKLVTADQLKAVLAEPGDPSRLGERLVEKGLIEAGQLERLLRIQRDMLIKHRAARGAQQAEAQPESAAAAPPERPVVEKPAARPASAPLPAADDPEEDVRRPPVARPGPSADAAPASGPAASAPGAPASGPAASAPAAPASGPAASAPAAQTATAGGGETAAAGASSAVGVAGAARPSGSGGRKEELHALLRGAVEARASDLHLHSGARMRMRVDGELGEHGDAPLDPAACEAMLADALDDGQWETLSRTGQVDFAYEVEGLGRFRANAYRQQRGLDAIFRVIPAEPPTLEGLGLPETLTRFTGYHQGMVLVTGPAGCGKSATMAALLDMVNESREEHIITVEDPIEVVHRSKTCLVNQRQVGPHTETFARALRAALREDPDIIGIGELRDLETISLALTAAETGHFVLGTLHTNSAIRTINRLIGVFPPNQQSQIRTMVSESLRAVVSQRLVRRADGAGRVPALEIMVVNKAVGNLIRENKTVQIGSILQTGAAQGMCLLDESLSRLVADGTVTQEEARRHCDDPRRFGGSERAAEQ